MSRFCSIFSQLLQLFPRHEFHRAVSATRAERHARGFTCWGQFVAMLFCQLGRAHSLREICGGLASCEGRLAHLGITAPRRSTLAYANEHRPWQLFEAVFYAMLARCRSVAAPKRFRLKSKLLTLDATMIDLCAELFPWAAYVRTKGAVKLHVTLDHDGCLPTVMVLTDGKTRETLVARHQRFLPGTILLFDRGYMNFRWFWALTQAEVFFVTRLHRNVQYHVIARRPVPTQRGILRDDIIQVHGRKSFPAYPGQLRRVRYRTPDGDLLDFLTNQMTWGPTTIARLYQQRWHIELFFKALKQQLHVKTFVGTSVNALRIQIWTALIALLVLKYLQFKARFGWSLSNLLALLRMNLFVYRDLWTWIDDPFRPPPLPPDPVQGALAFT